MDRAIQQLQPFGFDDRVENFGHIKSLRRAYYHHISISARSHLLLTKDSLGLVPKYPTIPARILQLPMPSLNNTGDLVPLKDSGKERRACLR